MIILKSKAGSLHGERINTEKGTHLEKEKKPERSLPARLEKRLPGGGVRSMANLGAAIQQMRCTLFCKVYLIHEVHYASIELSVI